MGNPLIMLKYLVNTSDKNKEKYLNKNKNIRELNEYNYNKLNHYYNVKNILDENPLFFT